MVDKSISISFPFKSSTLRLRIPMTNSITVLSQLWPIIKTHITCPILKLKIEKLKEQLIHVTKSKSTNSIISCEERKNLGKHF